MRLPRSPLVHKYYKWLRGYQTPPEFGKKSDQKIYTTDATTKTNNWLVYTPLTSTHALNVGRMERAPTRRLRVATNPNPQDHDNTNPTSNGGKMDLLCPY